MRIWVFLAVVLLAGGRAAAVSGDVSVLLGQNQLSEDLLDEAGVDSPFEMGALVNLDFQWPVMLAVDLLFGSEDTVQTIPAEFQVALATDVDTLDLHLGARYFFRKQTNLRPYVGGGLAWVTLDVKQVETGSFGPGLEYQSLVVDDGDSGLGPWLGGGLVWRKSSFQLGGDLRYADASAEVRPEGATESVKLDAGGLHFGVFAGWAW
jgi:hypothetical protein